MVVNPLQPTNVFEKSVTSTLYLNKSVGMVVNPLQPKNVFEK